MHKELEQDEEMQSHGSRILKPICTIGLENQGFPSFLGGSSVSTNPVKALGIRVSFSQFRKQHPVPRESSEHHFPDGGCIRMVV
ncbi:unnamed protein product [Schistosoma curassoni]|uniref:Ovule protein n=1 Tax=Schistosoma curassoni TaxID=6186 RepID=A0A183KK80_9TREM|nr:unnamed protein product [Schistosoma curassoni]